MHKVGKRACVSCTIFLILAHLPRSKILVCMLDASVYLTSPQNMGLQNVGIPQNMGLQNVGIFNLKFQFEGRENVRGVRAQF